MMEVWKDQRGFGDWGVVQMGDAERAHPSMDCAERDDDVYCA